MSNFKIWIDNPIGGTNVVAPETFENDAQRQNGFKAGTPASSILVNTALRQSNLVTTALMEAIGTPANDLGALSSLNDVKTVINNNVLDINNKTVSFTQSQTVANIVSGGTLSANFGRISKYLSDLDRRVTEAGFKSGSVTINSDYFTAVRNNLYKSGKYAFLSFGLVIDRAVSGFDNQICFTVPSDFAPRDVVSFNVCKIRNISVTPYTDVYCSWNISNSSSNRRTFRISKNWYSPNYGDDQLLATTIEVQCWYELA